MSACGHNCTCSSYFAGSRYSIVMALRKMYEDEEKVIKMFKNAEIDKQMHTLLPPFGNYRHFKAS